MILPSSNPFLQPEKVSQLLKQANKPSIHSLIPSLLFSSFHSSFQTNKQNKTINQSSESTQSSESIASVKEPIAVIPHSLRLILSLSTPHRHNILIIVQSLVHRARHHANLRVLRKNPINSLRRRNYIQKHDVIFRDLLLLQQLHSKSHARHT